MPGGDVRITICKLVPFVCVLVKHGIFKLRVAAREVEGINIFCSRLLSETLITTNMVVGQIDLSERHEREGEKVPSAHWL